jgi:hypothetical protein
MSDRSDPTKYVAMPRALCRRIYAAFTEDFKARDGYGGGVVTRENAIDPVVLHHMFAAILEDDNYDVFDELWGDE